MAIIRSIYSMDFSLGQKYKDRHGDVWVAVYAIDGRQVVIRLYDGMVGNWYDGKGLELVDSRQDKEKICE